MISNSFIARQSRSALHAFRMLLAVSRVAFAVGVIGTQLSGVQTALAQNTNATIRGQVLDPGGAYVPNAIVTVTNKLTHVVAYTGKSDSAGEFVAPQVIPGRYRLTVNAPGFKEAVIDNLVVTVAQVAAVNVSMEVGSVSDVVTVTASDEQQLERTTSEISTLITPAHVQNAPLFNRAPENLLAFIPGVTHGGAGDQPNTSQLSITAAAR